MASPSFLSDLGKYPVLSDYNHNRSGCSSALYPKQAEPFLPSLLFSKAVSNCYRTTGNRLYYFCICNNFLNLFKTPTFHKGLVPCKYCFFFISVMTKHQLVNLGGDFKKLSLHSNQNQIYIRKTQACFIQN